MRWGFAAAGFSVATFDQERRNKRKEAMEPTAQEPAIQMDFLELFAALIVSFPRHSMYGIYAYIDPPNYPTPTDRQSYGSPRERCFL